jgi:two-component system chemotaxis response regulator CheY
MDTPRAGRYPLYTVAPQFPALRKGLPMIPISAIRILIVDDDATMRTLTRRSLQHLGCTKLFDAANPIEALPIARSVNPHVIISDYAMPRMDGLEFAASVRKDPKLSRVGFVLLSGVADASVLSTAVDLRIDSFIKKPFSIGGLKERLNGVLERLTGSEIAWA